MYRLLLTVCCIAFFSSCDDDFELDAPYQDIPVVYAYLNPELEDNFIRVQKAFLGANGNAIRAAQTIDSLYYNEEEVTVSLSLGSGDPVILNQVNGEDFGILRDTGEFVNTPNLLYRVPGSIDLVGGQTANLTISRSGEEDATASTTLLSPMTIRFPTDAMAVVLENYATTINLRWNIGDGEPRVYDIRFFMNIREFDTNNPDNTNDRQLEFLVAENYEPDADGPTVSYVFENERFWRFLGNNLEENENIVRRFIDMAMVVTGVGQEIEDAINLEQANGGITSAQSTPVYSNVENGLGIFTSRVQSTMENIILSPRNSDTLRNGIYTKDLNFQ